MLLLTCLSSLWFSQLGHIEQLLIWIVSVAPFRQSLQQLRVLIGLWKDITPSRTIWETYSPPQTVTYDFYCTEAKHNKSTNTPWYLIIHVTYVNNCLETRRKTLKHFFFFPSDCDKWTVSIRLRILAPSRSRANALSPGHLRLTRVGSKVSIKGLSTGRICFTLC